MLWPSLAVISQDLSSPTPSEFSLEAKISKYTNCIREIRQIDVNTSHGVFSHTMITAEELAIDETGKPPCRTLYVY